jgi:hypothetical protein
LTSNLPQRTVFTGSVVIQHQIRQVGYVIVINTVETVMATNTVVVNGKIVNTTAEFVIVTVENVIVEIATVGVATVEIVIAEIVIVVRRSFFVQNVPAAVLAVFKT